jgi:hypothetical protein
MKDIIEDYKKAFENILGIISGQKPNYWVMKLNQYLSPTIHMKELPLGDKHGEFQHYNKICDTLEKLLIEKRAEYSCHFSEAPEKIKELLIK